MQLVGILNITPDSFSDGGRFVEPAVAIRQLEQLFADGAAIVDLGAESTRPGAAPLNDAEEWSRLAPVLTAALSRFPGRISVDSYHPLTQARAHELGEVIVNDVTGMTNPAMRELMANLQPRCIISHLPAGGIQAAHAEKPISTVRQVRRELLANVEKLMALGLKRDLIILDPGIGFGKTPELNWQLLQFAREVPDYPVMIGYSRKRFLGEYRMELAPNIAAGKIARDAGAAYLRVHDVAGHAALLG